MTDQIESVRSRANASEFLPVQEMRLAVVMYGGVSLAIYMNGVAQEFLNLVKATAPAKDDRGNNTDSLLWREEQLPPTARVYRKLGRLLGRTEADGADGPVRTRFVIDIVTGTSAGGINGVFLAKALANQEEMGGLTRMWREEGDLPKLLNDGAKPALLEGGAPDALLNSRRILELFNQAITGMRWDGGGTRPDLLACSSPYVEELDLFVTTTDMTGLLLPIRLEDRVIYERRYRNFYHFRYGYPAGNGAPYNSFQPLNTTFLAFACRCTSAFPFAFAPMDLETAVSICRPRQRGDWTGFYGDYLNAARTTAHPDHSVVQRDQGIDFPRRRFIDGGCLDNKPFSYAIDALRWKKSDIPVMRKLFYLEPAPAHPERDRESYAQPDALDSVYAGYVDLPRAENIREDLQRLLERNRLIGRLKDAMEAVAPAGARVGPSDTEAWSRTTLQSLRAAGGAGGPGAAAYAAYHRMKVSAVTDAIATTIVCASGLDADSDDALAVRYLVKAWRDETYPDIMAPPEAHPAAAREKPTSAGFLLQYDLDYRVRRLGFVRRAIDEYYRYYAYDAEGGEGCLQELVVAKRKINAIRRRLLRTDALARSHDPQGPNPLLPVLAQVEEALDKLDPALCATPGFSGLVQCILAGDSDAARLARAREFYRRIDGGSETGPIHRLANELAKLYAHARIQPGDPTVIGLFEASAEAVAILQKTTAAVPPIDGKPSLLDSYYGYESYDAATFPLLYGTGVGEVKEVEVVRISPDDAAPLCPRKPSTAKLAGDSLGHFGGFLAQDWREHDILWGRLDGVDRIINGLAPGMDPTARAALIREGQIGVLDEWLEEIGSEMNGKTLYALLTNPAAPPPAGAAATGNGWKLTPAQVVRSAREGAAAGLQGLTSREAVHFGQRSLAVVSSMSRGMAGRRSAAWSRAPLKVTGDLLNVANLLLRAEYWPWLVLMLAAVAFFAGCAYTGVWGYGAVGAFLLVGAVAGASSYKWLAGQTAKILGAHEDER